MENIRDFFLLYKQGRIYVPGTSEQILTRPKPITKKKCGAHDSVVTCVKPVTKRSLVQTSLWLLDVVCCAPRQRALLISTLS